MLQDSKLSVEEICRKLKPIFGDKISEVYLRYSMAESREEREQIAHILSALYYKNLNELLNRNVLLEPPKKMEGDYDLGTIIYAKNKLYPFSLREHDWPRHVCISGMSGSGKTNLALNIIQRFIEKDKPFLVFDWKKSFRPLVNADNELMVFTIGDDSVSNLFKTNINRPPKGVDAKEWINVLCDLLSESFFVSFGVHKILLETLDEAFKEWGIYNGSDNYPTWNHIKWRLEQKLQSIKGREAGWVESALRIATVLTFGNFGKVCNYKGEDSMNVEDLLSEKVIFELNSLGNIEKKFFCEFILTYIYKLKKAKQNTSKGFEHAIIVDEAHNIFLKDKTHFVKESVTDMIYREMREYGTSLICLDQHISKISDTVTGNSACHIAFQQQLPQDIWDISELMQLKDRKQYFSDLPVGSAIVKLSERYTSPFLVEVPFAGIRNTIVGDEDIENRMKCIFAGRNFEINEKDEFNQALLGKIRLTAPIVQEERLIERESKFEGLTEIQSEIVQIIKEKLAERETLLDIERYLESLNRYKGFDILKAVNYVFETQLKTRTIPGNPLRFAEEIKEETVDMPQNDGLTEEQRKLISFLKMNLNHDFSTVELYNQVGFSPRKGNKIKQELIEKNLIKIYVQKNDKGWRKIIRLN